MRHLNNYKKFFEDIAVNLSDSPAIKVAKQNYNTTQTNLTEYKAKKDQLTKIYTSTNPKDGGLLYDDKMIKTEVDKILGKTDVNSGKDRNPFLSELVVLLDMQRRIEKMSKSNADDKLTLDDLKQNMSGETNEKTKDDLSNRVKEIDNRISLNTADISKLNSDYTTSKKAFDTKMLKLVKDLQTSVKKIISQPKK
jgi:hypothetical protein